MPDNADEEKEEEDKIKPYIGDIDDPNLEDYVRDNIYIKTNYRICFHTWWDAAGSLFMLHNETLNVWSHLIGALLFLYMVFYVFFFMGPTSLHGSDNMIARWSTDFDQGRFDDLYCDR